MATVEQQKTARLTRAREISRLNREGMTDGGIAAVLGISEAIVRRVLDGPVRALREDRVGRGQKETNMGIIRQGDVILIPTTDATPKMLAPADPRGLVLAEGESSGHHHQVFGRGHKLYQRAAAGERMLVVVGKGAELRVVGGGGGGVERHTPVSLAPGRYVVRVQRSWSSESASRQVQD